MAPRGLAGLVVVSIVAVSSVVVVGQRAPGATAANTSVTKPWSPLLAPDGHPDLQGVWLNNRATPLERPKALAGRATLTDAEVAELRQRAERLFNNTNADFAAGDAVFLAALGNIDHFTSTTATGTTFEMIEREWDNATSLIVDPPDGRDSTVDA